MAKLFTAKVLLKRDKFVDNTKSSGNNCFLASNEELMRLTNEVYLSSDGNYKGINKSQNIKGTDDPGILQAIINVM